MRASDLILRVAAVGAVAGGFFVGAVIAAAVGDPLLALVCVLALVLPVVVVLRLKYGLEHEMIELEPEITELELEESDDE